MRTITGGRVVTPSGVVQADVIIRDGKIVGLAEPGVSEGERLDAAGCYVLPGGVDAHSHIMSDVSRAAAGAALGGTTTVLSFTNPEPGEAALACLLRRREEIAAAKPSIDIGLHAILAEPDRVSFEELAEIGRAGASGVKVFLAYRELGLMCTTRRLFELMTWTRELGLVMQVHCENAALIEALVDQAVGAGRRGPKAFVETRPVEVEEEAVARALTVGALAGAPTYLVHLSCGGALSQVRLARGKRRAPVFAEVCLHHLLLDGQQHDGADGARYLVCPPLRDSTEREAMWGGVADGTVDVVASDHAQQRSLVSKELSTEGASESYGLAGIGARLSLMLSEGVARGVPIRRLVELVSTRPATIFGHDPQKGAIVPGADADVVVWDPEANSVMEPGTFDDGTNDNVYSGRTFRGNVRAVLARGRLIAFEGKLVERDGGRFLPSRLASDGRDPWLADE